MNKETSDQPKTKSPAISEREINRRKFVQKILASMPAVGLACATPLAMGATGEASVSWVCRIGVAMEGPTFWLYVYVDCNSESIFLEVGDPHWPANGDCANPTSPACYRKTELLAHERSDDDLRIYYSPQLSKQGRQDFDKFKSFLLYNMQYG